MSHYCTICDKTIKLKSKNKHFISLYRREYEKLNQIVYTIKNPNSFDVDNLFNDLIINHIKKFDLYLDKVDFKLDFDNNLEAHIKTDIHLNISPINFKLFLSHRIDSIVLNGYIFSHITEMSIKKQFLIKRIMSYK